MKVEVVRRGDRTTINPYFPFIYPFLYFAGKGSFRLLRVTRLVWTAAFLRRDRVVDILSSLDDGDDDDDKGGRVHAGREGLLVLNRGYLSPLSNPNPSTREKNSIQ